MPRPGCMHSLVTRMLRAFVCLCAGFAQQRTLSDDEVRGRGHGQQADHRTIEVCLLLCKKQPAPAQNRADCPRMSATQPINSYDRNHDPMMGCGCCSYCYCYCYSLASLAPDSEGCSFCMGALVSLLQSSQARQDTRCMACLPKTAPLMHVS